MDYLVNHLGYWIKQEDRQSKDYKCKDNLLSKTVYGKRPTIVWEIFLIQLQNQVEVLMFITLENSVLTILVWIEILQHTFHKTMQRQDGMYQAILNISIAI